MSAYIAALRAADAQYLSASQTQTRGPDPSSRLRNEIAQWHALLPAELRQRPYRMEELLRIFSASPMAIGAALAQLGWRRRRNTSGAGPFIRYWLPPH